LRVHPCVMPAHAADADDCCTKNVVTHGEPPK
jgi:hypothetical protein